MANKYDDGDDDDDDGSGFFDIYDCYTCLVTFQPFLGCFLIKYLNLSRTTYCLEFIGSTHHVNFIFNFTPISLDFSKWLLIK